MTAELPQDFLRVIPDDLPVPEDDGACDHLTGSRLPSVPLRSTADQWVDLSELPGLTVVYCYPMTGRPGTLLPDGWVQTPGAAGCTPQSCSFRDRHRDLQALGARVFGLSAQSTADQQEAAERLALPYDLLSDSQLTFAAALGLPTFKIADLHLIKRVTLIVREGQVIQHFYPVFPPDKNVEATIAWLQSTSPDRP